MSSTPKTAQLSNLIFGKDLASWLDTTTNTKNTNLYKADTDVLALSCTWHRLRTSSNPEQRRLANSVSDYKSAILTENIGAEDFDKAAKIRDYYGKKIVMWKLRGQHLSGFRTALADVLTSTPTEWFESNSGVIFRLPEFYDYDTAIDAMLTDHYCGNMPDSDKKPVKRDLSLKPVKALTRATRAGKWRHHWFKEEGGHLVLVILDANNLLLPLWDTYIGSGNLRVEGMLSYGCKGEFDHYVLEKWKFVV